MKIRNKLVVIVAVSILLTSMPGAVLIYHYAKQQVLSHESETLVRTAASFANSVSQQFARSEPKLKALARILEGELAKAPQSGEIAEFQKTLELNPDGVWRNRKPGFNGRYEAGVFLPSSSPVSEVQKIQHLRIKKVMDRFGAAANEDMENIWYLSPQRSEIIFDKTYPEFAFEQKADNDYTQTPWLTYTSPQLNPGRQFRLTPPLFDPVPKVWMVSTLYPLYVNNQWLGTLGEDMPLSRVLQARTSADQRYSGVQHFLLDSQGNFVLAGPWQQTLESSPEGLHRQLAQEPALSDLLKTSLQTTPRELKDDFVLQGRHYLVVGSELASLHWRYFQLVPIDQIMASTQYLFVALTGLILLVTTLTGAMIAVVVNDSLIRRINLLRDSMSGYSRDKHLLTLGGSVDEIDEVTRVHQQMNADIHTQLATLTQAQAELSQNEELLRFALEGSGDGVWDWDMTSDRIFFSPRLKHMLGYELQDLADNPQAWQSLLHPQDIDATLACLRDCVAGKTPVYSCEYQIRCKDQSYRWILDRGMIVSRSADGTPLRMVGTHADITERKQAQASALRSSQLLLAAIETIDEAFVLYGPDDRLLLCNENYRELYASSRDLIVEGARFEDIVRQGALRGQYQAAVGRVEEWVAERMAAHRSGNQALIQHLDDGRVLRVIERRMPDGHTVGFRIDITDLVRATEAAQEANRAKSRFLTTMSHEVRTPMNGILGMAQLLLMPHLQDSERMDYAHTILRSGQSLLALLNDILDLSKIEAGKLQIESIAFEPEQLVHECQALFDGAAKAKDLLLEGRWLGQPGQHYRGDATRLRQMLSNLTGNAIKFTQQGSVQLEATEIRREDASRAWLEFSVSDTGMGIAADKLHLLFQPFSQTDSSMTRQYGGSGLGLSIVSNLAQLMGGEVGVTSEPGQGSRFWFRVPCDSVAEPLHEAPVKEAATASADSVVPLAAPASVHVLVVEDNAINRMVIEALLGKLAYTVSVAHDGAQALDAIIGGAVPDLVLMDLHMPVMDGYTATQRIRQWEAQNQRAHLPIIALTADAFEQDRQRCLAVGMDDFLTKPISLAALKAALTKWHNAPNQPTSVVLPATPKILDLARFQSLSQELLPLLAQNKFDALGKIKELQQLVRGTIHEDELASINQHLQNFAFEQACTQLKRLCDVISDQHPA